MARLMIIADTLEPVRQLRAALGPQPDNVAALPWPPDVGDLAASESPDLVLVALPERPDPRTSRYVGELARQAAVLVVGDRERGPELLECVRAGAADAICLPIEPELMATRVRAWLEHARQGRLDAERLQAAEARSTELERRVTELEVTDGELREARRQQRYLATHDPLTDLPNRVLLQRFARQSFAHASCHHHSAGVIVIDLDRFRGINAHFGRRTGDDLLRQVARDLRTNVRRADLVGRLHADAFAVVLSRLDTRDDVARVAQKLHDVISRQLQLGGHELLLTPSMGMAVFPDDGDNAEELFSHAEAALKLAKQDGRGQRQFYSRRSSAPSLEHMRLEDELRGAIDRGEMALYYQPQIDAAKGEMVGAEAVARWHHPEMGMVPPGRFIPVAEEAGLIADLGRWVLHEACTQKRRWEKCGLGGFPVSVNVSFQQIKSGDLSEVVLGVLEDTGLEPTHLDLEITENSIMDDLERALTSLRRLEREGVRISIDDFGTGYSSLSVLGKFPTHTLKIDQAFVRDIHREPVHSAITRTIVAMAHELGLGTLAEGVETVEELETLGELGVTRMQGFLFDRPLPVVEFEERWAREPQTDLRLSR